MLDRRSSLRRGLTAVALFLPAAGAVASACSSSPPASTSSSSGGSSSTSSSSTSSGSSSSSGGDAGKDAGVVARVPITVTGTTDITFATADHMFAAAEMQIAGEPLAETMGRSLAGYSRDYVPPNVYFTPPGTPYPPASDLTVPPGLPYGTGDCIVDAGTYSAATSACPELWDLPGFATAVESYEYSKQPMNNLALESGAGTSFLYGPLVNPTQVTGAAAIAILLPRMLHFAAGANTVGGNALFDMTADGTDPANRLGWPGLWPTLMPYSSFDPTIIPADTHLLSCSISSDDDPNASGQILNLDYECDYTSLHLPNRDAQLTKTLTPGASGWAGWKYALWVLNYLQSMHDSAQTAIATVAPGDLANVGVPGNTVVGLTTASPPPPSPVAGTYLGSSDIEGFQAQVMIDEVDNAAYQWLTQLTTTDGATLSGFASVESALEYDYTAPLQWFPGAIAVTETPDTASGYPQPTGYAITDSGSHLFDLLGLASEYATFYTLTDTSNTGVGGTQPAIAYFDGDPFPADDQIADGEATLHDRALGVLRVLLVNIDRLHRDPTSGVLIDDVSFTGATPTQGTTVSTTSVAYSVVGLRTLRRGLTSQLQLYSNVTPDTQFPTGYATVLDNASLPLTGAPGGAGTTTYDRLTTLIDTESQLLLNSLTTEDGHAYAGWNVSTSTPTSTDDVLDSYTAAIRGLLSAQLCSGQASGPYLTRAVAVFNRMDSVFYSQAGLIYTATPGATSVAYTPLRFAVLEAALRDMYELVGVRAADAALGKLLKTRVARLIKLVLNGWDDLNGDGTVDYDSECITMGPVPGFGSGVIPVGRGGLQMAERALSGDLGFGCDSTSAAVCADGGQQFAQLTPDREKDCVPNIFAAQLPSALANQITFTIGN